MGKMYQRGWDLELRDKLQRSHSTHHGSNGSRRRGGKKMKGQFIIRVNAILDLLVGLNIVVVNVARTTVAATALVKRKPRKINNVFNFLK